MNASGDQSKAEDLGFAHSLPGRPKDEWQPLGDHLEGVARTAADCAAKFDSADVAWNAAWIHDAGKAADGFQTYLLRQNNLDDETCDTAASGRINHSSAGAALAHEVFGEVASLALAYAAAGHHAGLPDYYTADGGRGALQCRLEEGKADLDRIRAKLKGLAVRLRPGIRPPRFVRRDNFHLWVRMLFSCLVDADFLDTERFIQPDQSIRRGGYPLLEELKPAFDVYIEAVLARAPSTPVNAARREILEACRAAAPLAPGLFSLTVPTGGGKTLASVAFALDHAVLHNKSRLIYVIPYTSIIEQTAEVLRRIFGDEKVIEHHSNLDPDKETPRSRLASENWDAPVVVTTNVQFFESLYAARPGRCRKLHNLVGSVVVLDEAQLLPPQWQAPCVEVIDQLIANFGVTLLLSTATQPPLPTRAAAREIVPHPERLSDRLRRTAVALPADMARPSDWDEIAGRLKRYDQVLCIVNTRRDGHDLFRRMPEGTLHLSALMCGEHRSQVIARIKERLAAGEPLRVVSTQVVEAGVDIDFPVVFRALAGLDAIVQAAGRCNREGRLNAAGRLGEVQVFVPPKPSPRGLLRKAEDTTRALLATGDLDPENPHKFRRYFELFYSRLNDTGRSFMDLLQKDSPRIPFRTAAERFRFIDDQVQQPVFVRFGESERWIAALRREGPRRASMRRLQRFTVTLSRHDFERARSEGLVEEVWPGFWLWIGRYSEAWGLDLFGSGWAPEDLMV
jgi:CRISPR-associated endonuclease/helicase Cas3